MRNVRFWMTMLVVAIGFSACGGTKEPQISYIENYEKNVVEYDIQANSQAEALTKLDKAIRNTPTKCTTPKKSKNLLFDIYYTDNCSLSSGTLGSEGNRSLVRELATYRTKVEKTVGGSSNSYKEETSYLVIKAPFRITKSDSGFHVSIDAVSEVYSKQPDGVPHYWDVDELTKRFHEDMLIMDLN